VARHHIARELTPALGVPQLRGVALATPADDAEMRALLRRSEMRAVVRVAFTREPDYFAGAGLAGAVDHTVVHRSEGRLDGIARLSLHILHRNGVPRRIGYLGELRLAPETPRSTRVLRDGYDFIRTLLGAGGVSGCFTSIAADNARTRRVLEQGKRFGLPVYSPVAELVTLVAPIGVRGRPSARGADNPVVDRDELANFLERHARGVQLSPRWDDARWVALARHGVVPADFCVIHAAGRVVATGTVWDQRAFKQTVICGYDGPLKVAYPFVNAIARVGLAPPLPAPGTVLQLGSVLGAAVDDDRYLEPLWEALRASAQKRGMGWLAIARDARDPQLTALRRIVRGREYHTRLYEVSWNNAAAWTDPWDGRCFGPEVSLL